MNSGGSYFFTTFFIFFATKQLLLFTILLLLTFEWRYSKSRLMGRWKSNSWRIKICSWLLPAVGKVSVAFFQMKVNPRLHERHSWHWTSFTVPNVAASAVWSLETGRRLASKLNCCCCRSIASSRYNVIKKNKTFQSPARQTLGMFRWGVGDLFF